VIEDILGRKVRRKVEDLLPKLEKKAEATATAREKKKKTISEKWVDEF
jgi:siroheme synthase (precorrin-2 oxidase/ferrochelatase)